MAQFNIYRISCSIHHSDDLYETCANRARKEYEQRYMDLKNNQTKYHGTIKLEKIGMNTASIGNRKYAIIAACLNRDKKLITSCEIVKQGVF